MINFFRKNRKKLADDSKPLNYLRYAVGEILLVVVGILIAVQINTWNEERKLALTEKSYYIGLYADLQRDSLQYHQKIRNANHNMRKLDNILNFIENEYDISRTTIYEMDWGSKVYRDTLALVHSLSTAGFFQFPQLFENTIEDLRNTGNLKLLNNTKLKDDLLNYYNAAELWGSFTASFQPTRTAIEFALIGILDKRTRIAYTTVEGFESVDIDYLTITEKMKATTELENLTIGMYQIQARIHIQSRFALEMLNPIMKDLLNEINK